MHGVGCSKAETKRGLILKAFTASLRYGTCPFETHAPILTTSSPRSSSKDQDTFFCTLRVGLADAVVPHVRICAGAVGNCRP